MTKPLPGFLLDFFQSFPRQDLLPFTRATAHWEQSRLQCLLDIGSELTLIPGDPTKHDGLPAEAGASGGQVINGVLAEV